MKRPAPKPVTVRLRKPLRKALRQGHPWVYRDALQPTEVAPGVEVTVVDERGRFVARGWAEGGPIGVRVWTTRDEPIDAELLVRRVEVAAALRRRIIDPSVTAYRLVHGEGDRMPGIVCDVYGSFAVIVLDGMAAAARRAEIVEVLRPLLRERGVQGTIVRQGRRAERTITLEWGTAPEPTVVVSEYGLQLCANLLAGQKTGLFLDHRESRRRVRALASGQRVLDLFAYVGGFSASAGLGGAAEVVSVDLAPEAIAYARQTWSANDLPADKHTATCGAVDAVLERLHGAGRRFDLIVADPPSFAPNAKAKHKAMRAYVQLHRAALDLLESGGFYLGASCSSHVGAADFEATVLEAADKRRRSLQIIDRWGAPGDHPRLPGFFEGDYLAVVLVRAA